MPDADFTVTLLGTGVPRPNILRFGAATLIKAGQEILLFDCGRGTVLRLSQQDVPISAVDKLFLTHLHSDHITGIHDLYLGGAVLRLDAPLNIFGPFGTCDMMKHLKEASQADITSRGSNGLFESNAFEPKCTEIEDGFKYENGGVEVTAFEVKHKSDLGGIAPAFGFRIDYDGRSVTLSGDTIFNENLIKHAQGTDLLIHEVIGQPSGEDELPLMVRVPLSVHTTPTEAGEVFIRVRPKLAVYSHVFIIEGTTEQDIIEQTKAVYDGPFELGEDLAKYEIGTQVKRLPS